MPRGRAIWAIMAGVVAVLAVVIVQLVEMRLVGVANRTSLWAAFIGAGGGVMWFADRLGLLASPYTEPTLGLSEKPTSERPREPFPIDLDRKTDLQKARDLPTTDTRRS